MCEPGTVLAVASLALTAAGEGARLDAEAKGAKAQTAYQKQLVTANNTETANQLSALRIQQAQEHEAGARELQKARQASRGARSTALVAAGDAGASGQSVEALLQEYSANLGQFTEASNRQRKISNDAYTDKAEAISAGARYQNLNINAPVVGANYGAAAVRFGAAALGTYREIKRPASRG